MKYLIAIEENKKLDSKLSEHFGHCPYFAIYETETKKIRIIKNKINHSNKKLNPVEQIMKLKPNIIFSLGIGKKAIELFSKKKVKIKTGNYKILKEVIDNIDKLHDLNKDCIEK